MAGTSGRVAPEAPVEFLQVEHRRIACRRIAAGRIDDRAIDGRPVFAQCIGEAPRDARATLVFLHEGLGAMSMWKDFPQQLCARTGLPGFLYDRLGYGLSDEDPDARTPDYLHQEATRRLPAVLAQARVERPILVGHSDGASIALLYAAARPTAVEALICEAAHVFVEEVTLAGIREAVRLYKTSDLPQRLARHHGGKTERVFRSWSETWLAHDFRHWNIESSLPAIAAPALVLQGAVDEYGTPAQVDAIAQRVGGPVETHLLRACAHVPHHQARDQVLALAGDFLRRHVTR